MYVIKETIAVNGAIISSRYVENAAGFLAVFPTEDSANAHLAYMADTDTAAKSSGIVRADYEIKQVCVSA